MENPSLEQQSVILKGIASQILQMNKPSFKIVEELFKEFDIDFKGYQTYNKMYKALQVACSFDDEAKEYIKERESLKSSNDLAHRIAHFAYNSDGYEVSIRNKVMSLG